MTRWFRVYDDLVDDPKVQCLAPDLFRALINIWCISSKNGGRLPSIEQVAFSLHLKADKAAEILTKLERAGLLDRDETAFRPHNWDARQFKSDGSTDRVKQHRERKRNGGETFHRPLRERPHRQSTDTEADTDKKEPREPALVDDGWPIDAANQFWQRYPLKVAKRAALKALESARKRVTFEALMAGVNRYVASQNPQFYCHAATWLNADRWLDEVSQNGKPSHFGSASDQAERLADLVRSREREIGLGGTDDIFAGDRGRRGDVEILPPERGN